MDAALQRFHTYRTVFVEEGVRANFALPRQHALVHYVRSIRLFGSPNGLCSSITESKHIKAVKEPWRDSNRNEPLEQIIQKNVRLGKIAAARVDFGARGMLDGNVRRAAYEEVGFYRPRLHVEEEDEAETNDAEKVKAYNEGKLVIDVEDIDSEPAPIDVVMAKRVRACVLCFSPLIFSHTRF